VKKAKVIGLSISLVVLAIVFGIASIPDEVLSESNSVETNQNIPRPINLQSNISKEKSEASQENSESFQREVKELKNQNAIMKAELEGIKTESKVLEPVSLTLEDPTTIEESEIIEETKGKVIRIEINDGVGGGDQ